MLGTGVRGYRDVPRLLVGAKEAEWTPEASWREQLCAGSWKTGRVSPRKGVLCHRGQGMSQEW